MKSAYLINRQTPSTTLSIAIPLRYLPFGVLGGAITCLAAGFGTTRPEAMAAPKPAQTLSFELTARFDTRETSTDTSTPEQTVSAKVYLDGKRLRAESQIGDRFVVYLYTPPFGYKLLPTSKTGLRYRVNPTVQGNNGATFDPKTLLPLLQNPAAIRSTLNQQGGRRVGTSRLGNTPVDVYTASKFRGQPVKVKAWLRQSDALPARLELTSKKLTVVASWRNYQRGHALANSLFTVPAGYHVRESRSDTQ